MSSIVEKKSFQFSLNIIPLVKTLKNQNEYIFADQLLRSATSIGANICEAGAGQSKKDFYFQNGDSFKKKPEKHVIG